MNDTTSEFLWNASMSVPTNSSSLSILRCHYLSKCKRLQNQNEIILPAKLFRENAMCNFCCNMWSDGKFHLKLLPKKVTGKRMLKIIHKSEFLSRLITNMEESLLTRYYRNNSNKLVILCLVCHKETIIILSKSKKQETDVEQEIVKANDSRKKKRKLRDRYAGLKCSAFPDKSRTSASVKKRSTKRQTISRTNTSVTEKKALHTLVLNKKSHMKKDKLKNNSKCSSGTQFTNRFKKTNTLQKMLAASEMNSRSGSSLKDFFISLK